MERTPLGELQRRDTGDEIRRCAVKSQTRTLHVEISITGRRREMTIQWHGPEVIKTAIDHQIAVKIDHTIHDSRQNLGQQETAKGREFPMGRLRKSLEQGYINLEEEYGEEKATEIGDKLTALYTIKPRMNAEQGLLLRRGCSGVHTRSDTRGWLGLSCPGMSPGRGRLTRMKVWGLTREQAGQWWIRSPRVNPQERGRVGSPERRSHPRIQATDFSGPTSAWPGRGWWH